ncbi:hypothetical protein EV356DRAFT_565149 [Viridothelium virens]|uniref:Uncharacterized protein n=1 Tax=Viridothelium virens TaxID=1048519 RepID=A0A6A6HG89_VIRVR|nr:hypothetical protein EV356DRAFT_565149 [Viridothelium virens]
MVFDPVSFGIAAGAFGFLTGTIGGTVASIFGIIGGIQARIPSGVETYTRVRVGIGLDPGEFQVEPYGGDVPGVSIYDDVGNGLGFSSGCIFPCLIRYGQKKIKAGNFRDIQIRQKTDNQRNNGVPTYVAVSAGGTDAICISYISLTDFSGLHHGWVGDVGAECGGDWFYSTQIVGNNNYRPRCVWISSDPNFTLGHTAMGMHITDFSIESSTQVGLRDEYRRDRRTMCGSLPRFSFYTKFKLGKDWLPVFHPTLQYTENGATRDIAQLWTDGVTHKGRQRGVPAPSRYRPTRPSERPAEEPAEELAQMPVNATAAQGRTQTRIRRRKEKRNGPSIQSAGNHTQSFYDLIVTTNTPEHDVATLCNSPSSLGPSLVNYKQGKFCDMSTKKIWPVCHGYGGCNCLSLGSYSSGSDNSTSMNKTAVPQAEGVIPYMHACGKRTLGGRSSSTDAQDHLFKKVIQWA